MSGLSPKLLDMTLDWKGVRACCSHVLYAPAQDLYLSSLLPSPISSPGFFPHSITLSSPHSIFSSSTPHSNPVHLRIPPALHSIFFPPTPPLPPRNFHLSRSKRSSQRIFRADFGKCDSLECGEVFGFCGWERLWGGGCGGRGC